MCTQPPVPFGEPRNIPRDAPQRFAPAEFIFLTVACGSA